MRSVKKRLESCKGSLPIETAGPGYPENAVTTTGPTSVLHSGRRKWTCVILYSIICYSCALTDWVNSSVIDLGVSFPSLSWLCHSSSTSWLSSGCCKKSSDLFSFTGHYSCSWNGIAGVRFTACFCTYTPAGWVCPRVCPFLDLCDFLGMKRFEMCQLRGEQDIMCIGTVSSMATWHVMTEVRTQLSCYGYWPAGWLVEV